MKLPDLKGRLYLYQGKDHRVERVVEKDGMIIIYTDIEAIEVSAKRWKAFLGNDFLESEEPSAAAMRRHEQGPMASAITSISGQMRNVILDALEEVKAGGDIKKARFALDAVKQTVSVVRLEMEAHRLDAKLRGGERE